MDNGQQRMGSVRHTESLCETPYMSGYVPPDRVWSRKLSPMPGRINSRELGVAPATLLEYLEGESSGIGAFSQLGREEEGTSSLRAEFAALLQLILSAEPQRDLLALLDCQIEIWLLSVR